MPTFRLDQQPWIPVVGTDGLARTVNLVDVFADASRISEIAGSPLEVAAISRFLLAVVHLTNTPTSLDAWGKLWRNRADLMSRCAEYVEAQTDAWDLFHEKHPFGQLPELGKTTNPAHILVYEAARKNNAVFADHSIEDAPAPIPAAALVRGLIVTNAYAGSSGGGYRSGPLAMRTVAMLGARALDETLLLNLLFQCNPPTDYDWFTYGHPFGGAERSVDVVRRYLWTSRRVRLIPEAADTAAATMMLAPGNEMPEVERTEDPMVAMRKDSNGTAYVPLRLEAGRALWRAAHVLLNCHKNGKRLAAVDQLKQLQRRRLLSAEQPVSMRVCAVAGEAQGPSTKLWRDEMLPFGLSVIAEDKRYAELEKAVHDAEEAGRALRKRIYSFAARYLQNGTESKPDKKDVVRLVDELSQELVDFWSALAPAGERIACDGFDETEWATLLKKASDDAFRRAVKRLPPNARRHRAEFARREIKDNKQKKGTTA